VCVCTYATRVRFSKYIHYMFGFHLGRTHVLFVPLSVRSFGHPIQKSNLFHFDTNKNSRLHADTALFKWLFNIHVCLCVCDLLCKCYYRFHRKAGPMLCVADNLQGYLKISYLAFGKCCLDLSFRWIRLWLNAEVYESEIKFESNYWELSFHPDAYCAMQ